MRWCGSPPQVTQGGASPTSSALLMGWGVGAMGPSQALVMSSLVSPQHPRPSQGERPPSPWSLGWPPGTGGRISFSLPLLSLSFHLELMYTGDLV